MSVFTPVSDDDARRLLEHYTLGELEALEGIAQGMENTNYFLTTTTGEYVLTLFEHIPAAEVDRLSRLPLRSWAPGRRDHFIRIRGDFVSGRRVHTTELEATP